MTPNVLTACVVVVFVFPGILRAADWPQLQRDAARTGWTPDSPAPPYEIARVMDFGWGEALGQQMQPIVYSDIMYVPTMRGRLYAFKPETGERLWVREGNGISIGSAATGNGLVFVASLDGWVRAFKFDTGEPDWQADLGCGISASPCLEADRLYIGTRKGDFFCIEAATGKTVWKTTLPHYVWSSAAVADGKVFVGTDGEIHLYSLDAATGAIKWESEALPGLYLRDFCPVVTAGKVYICTCPAENNFPRPSPYDTYGGTPAKYLPELKTGKLPADFAEANEKLVAILTEEFPSMQTMFCFDAATGVRPFVVGYMRVLAGMCHAAAVPAVDAEGMLQVTVPFIGGRFGRMDPNTGRIIWIVVGEDQPPGPDGQERFDGVGTNTDERHASSCGGDRVYWKHGGLGGCDASLVFDIKTRAVYHLPKHYGGPVLKVSVETETSQEKHTHFSWTGRHFMTRSMFVPFGDSGQTAAAVWKNYLFKNEGRTITVYRGSETEGGAR